MVGRMILTGLIFMMYARVIFVGTMLLWIGVESRFSPAVFWETVSAAATEIRSNFDRIVTGYSVPGEPSSTRVADATLGSGFPQIGIND